jgi:hypothetical protein
MEARSAAIRDVTRKCPRISLRYIRATEFVIPAKAGQIRLERFEQPKAGPQGKVQERTL